jgi:hypothetical protein
MGNYYFWPTKDVSMLEKKLVFLLKEDIQQEGLSNLLKRKVSCRNQVLSPSLCSEGFDVNENINNKMDGTPEDESNGYKCNIFYDATNGGILKRASSNSMNENTNEGNGEKE